MFLIIWQSTKVIMRRARKGWDRQADGRTVCRSEEWHTQHTITPNKWPKHKRTSTGIDADASKRETSPGYFNSKLVYSYTYGTIFPWEFPEISLAYSHIFLKGPSRSMIYGQIFWPPYPHPHIASPASIYHQNQLSFVFRFSFHLTIHFENAGNICNKYDL